MALQSVTHEGAVICNAAASTSAAGDVVGAVDGSAGGNVVVGTTDGSAVGDAMATAEGAAAGDAVMGTADGSEPPFTALFAIELCLLQNCPYQNCLGASEAPRKI
jgi:hypothetical protein